MWIRGAGWPVYAAQLVGFFVIVTVGIYLLRSFERNKRDAPLPPSMRPSASDDDSSSERPDTQ
jgi:hypothetical protein